MSALTFPEDFPEKQEFSSIYDRGLAGIHDEEIRARLGGILEEMAAVSDLMIEAERAIAYELLELRTLQFFLPC